MDEEIIQEIIMYCVSALLLLFAFIHKAYMDISGANLFEGGKDNPKNRNSISSDDKYAKDENGNLKPYKKKWYYFGLVTPKFEEKFMFSTTLCVPFVDYWHRQQFFFLNYAFVAFCILLPYPIYSYIAVRFLYLIGFNLIYERR